jgi:hypothetical protein
MDSEALKWAKKAKILQQILANYQKEKQALLTHNILFLKEALDERAHYIETLRLIGSTQTGTLLPLLQKHNVLKIIKEIQQERAITNRLFPG